MENLTSDQIRILQIGYFVITAIAFYISLKISYILIKIRANDKTNYYQ